MSDPFQIAFVCTGNTCRSPIAEALFKKILQDQGLAEDVKVSSAGINADKGIPASAESKEACKPFEASLDEFASRQVTAEFCQVNHLIFVMEAHHRDHIDEHFPEYADKVRLLGSLISDDPNQINIMDPFGASQDVYDHMAQMVYAALENLLENYELFKKRFYFDKRMILSVGTDHRGYETKNELLQYLESSHYPVIDCGTHSTESCDHPQYAFAVSEQVALGRADRGILICSSGHGMAISANKVPMVRAVLPINKDHAKLSRSHNNANVLVLGADYLPMEEMKNICDAWLAEEFLGGKYQRRINLITAYENGTLYQQVQPV